MRARIVATTVALALLLAFAPGCCIYRDAYDAFLAQVAENLNDDIRPKMERLLEKDERPDDLKQGDLKLIDDTVFSLRRTIDEGPEAGSKALGKGAP